MFSTEFSMDVCVVSFFIEPRSNSFEISLLWDNLDIDFPFILYNGMYHFGEIVLIFSCYIIFAGVLSYAGE